MKKKDERGISSSSASLSMSSDKEESIAESFFQES
jgi:hypothetical protein